MTLAQLMRGDPRHPWEVVLEATAIGDALMRDAKAKLLAGEEITVEQIDRLIELTNFAHHLSKTAIDTKAAEQVALAFESHMRNEGQMMTDALLAGLDALDPTPEQRERALLVMHAKIQGVPAPDIPLAIDAPVDAEVVDDAPARVAEGGADGLDALDA